VVMWPSREPMIKRRIVVVSEIRAGR